MKAITSLYTAWLQGLGLGLALMLLIAPPGGSVCWPLPDGRHLHLGWTDPSGHDTLQISVFIHHAEEPVQSPTHQSLNTVSLADIPHSGSALLILGTLALVVPGALCWRDVQHLIAPSQPGPLPLRYPPRYLATS